MFVVLDIALPDCIIRSIRPLCIGSRCINIISALLMTFMTEDSHYAIFPHNIILR